MYINILYIINVVHSVSSYNRTVPVPLFYLDAAAVDCCSRFLVGTWNPFKCPTYY